MSELATIHLGGPGPRAAVLLHGFIGSGKNLRGLAQKWAAADPERALWLVDLTGHGTSPPLPTGADLDTIAADVDETMRARGVALPVDVVGHSLGGRVALAWARRAPGALASLLLVDIAPGPIDRARSTSRHVLDVLLRAPAEAADRRDLRRFLVGERLSPAIADWLLMNVVCDPPPCRWRIDRAALDALQDRVNGDDLWPVVEQRLVPKLTVVRGGRSRYVGDDDVHRFAAAGVPTLTIADAGHDLHVEAPEALLPLLPTA